jgi:hypothetical protein
LGLSVGRSWVGYPPGVSRKCVITKGLKVLCFDTLLQVFILRGLRAGSRSKIVTPPGLYFLGHGRWLQGPKPVKAANRESHADDAHVGRGVGAKEEYV